MFQEHGRLISGIFISLLLANLLNFLINLYCLKLFAKIVHVPMVIIFPVVFLLCITGSYLSTNSLFGVIVMSAFSILGYLMIKLEISFLPMIIGFILGPIFETSLRQTLILSDNSLMIFLTRPIPLVFIVLSIFSIWQFGVKLKKKKSR